MSVRSAKFWSNRAERARKIAEQMNELDTRRAILKWPGITRFWRRTARSSKLSISGNRRTRTSQSDVRWAW